jgi:hypothetical protein
MGRRVEWVTLACTICGKTFERTPAWVRQQIKEPMCSRECNGKRRALTLVPHSGNMKGRKRKDLRYGPENPAWKGGVTYWRKAGNYPPIKYVRAPAWALTMARKDGYVMEHRLIMATLCGRLLIRTETVHHRDHNPLNNAAQNLELWPTNRDHKLAEHGRFVPGVANRWCRMA